ncbi:hypothetical protein DFH09DRAFT_1250833 [Mycena vulgaris]|nr:hypothetical protein DFH09DRAFT_1250833 [Mycena vulgaris]
MSLLCLSGADVVRATSEFSPAALQTLMAHVFSVLSSGTDNAETSPASYTPHRIVFPTQNHTALFMPARIAQPEVLRGTSIKVVCVPTSPTDLRGLPASTLVLDEDSGAVKAILNAANLTALRNAAGSLLSTNLVGPREPTSLVAFGAGTQIKEHLLLFLRAFPSIRTCTIVNRFYQRPTLLLSASLVICATSSTVPLFPSAWVPEGAHIMLIGSYKPTMHEVDGTLVQRALSSRGLVVDSRSACLAEAGELIDAGVTADQLVEIGELVSFGADGALLDPARRLLAAPTDTGSVTIFKSVGVGLQDVAIACAVVQKAEEMGIGSHVEWS